MSSLHGACLRFAPLVATSIVGCATPIAAPRPDVLVDLDVVDMPVADLTEAIGRQMGSNVLVDPRDERHLVSGDFSGLPWRDAVDQIARVTGTTVDERFGGFLLLTNRPTPQVTLKAEGDVRNVVARITAIGGKTVELPDDVEGHVQVDFREVGWELALIDTLAQVGKFEDPWFYRTREENSSAPAVVTIVRARAWRGVR